MAAGLHSTILMIAPLAPLAGAAIAGLLGTRFLGNRANRAVSCGAAILGVAIALAISIHALLAVTHGANFNGTLYIWMNAAGISMEIGFLIDSLSALMMCIVTSVSLMVHVYTIGYMRDDEGYNRFFAYLSLFTFAMLMLVMSNNFLQLFFGWEAVGLISYLLIGFWFDKPGATRAGLKAFLVNRIGDVGFILGIGLLLAYTGSLNFTEIFARRLEIAGLQLPGTDWMVISAACICLFIGAMAKSAQFPLHVWLPDSMEGPTPISALIHAATMVAAGIFMVSRMSPLFELSDAALSLMLVAGAITTLFMGLAGMVQNDIKRVIAYSTLSQLGYMTVALGASAYPAASFHMMTHAFFKALLFLAAGSVIIGMHHDQDIRNMGGLRRYMPVTWITALVGVLALSGLPFLSGFYSKESIIEAVYHSRLAGAGFAYFAVLATVFVTAFYALRWFLLVFHGDERFGQHEARQGGDVDEHAGTSGHVGLMSGDMPHESPRIMTIPLILLAIPSLAIGFITVGPVLFGDFFGGVLFVAQGHEAMRALSMQFQGALSMGMHGLVSLPFLLMMAGGALAWYGYIVNPSWPGRVRQQLPHLHALLENSFYIDRIYDAVFLRAAVRLGRYLWLIIDRRLIDQGLVKGAANITRRTGQVLWGGDRIVIDEWMVNGSTRLVNWFAMRMRQWQTGHLSHYALVMILAMLGFLIYFLPLPFTR